jgi:hypothetical protein
VGGISGGVEGRSAHSDGTTISDANITSVIANPNPKLSLLIFFIFTPYLFDHPYYTILSCSKYLKYMDSYESSWFISHERSG